jgi:[citrate (pro-3S)-lyase] ligase
MSYDYDLKILEMFTSKDKEKVEKFLETQNLKLGKNIDYTIGVFYKDEIIGTGSLSGKVLKSIAVRCDFQGEAITNKIVSKLVNEAFHKGETHLFVYTKPENKALFESLGFYNIAEVDKVCLLENKRDGIKNFTEEIQKKKKEGDIIGSIVMNCNPFTYGHQYLIEKASKECDVVHIFVVWEDKSSFPPETRYNLIKKGTEDLKNVVIHKGKDYIISNATFPNYFIKGEEDLVASETKLDVEIFKKYIVPALGVNRRYIGEEPYCKTTNLYNETMKTLLPEAGVEVIVVERKKLEDKAISASTVREALSKDNIESLKKLVPKTTYEFFQTEEGKKIIEKIKNTNSRH